jgi:uncharacterized cupredoxin-like copper-binding protein
MPSRRVSFVQFAVVATFFLLLGALAFRGVGRTPDGAPDPAPMQEMAVATADFSFAAPRTVPAGLTRIVLRNQGSTYHHVQLVRLAPGHTYEEYLERLAARDFAPAWATFVGGPESPEKGREAEATVMLAEGEYVIMCLISGADHVPHVAKGMSAPLTVGPPATPVADVRMILREYAFEIEPTLSAGRHTLRIENRGTQVHHVAIVKLGRGRTAQQALEWAASLEGTPPDHILGGTTGIAPGLTNHVTMDFESGEYALICFVPDTKDGKSHARHGMIRQITVQ